MQHGKLLQHIVLKDNDDESQNARGGQKYGNSLGHRSCTSDRVFVYLPYGATAYGANGQPYDQTIFAPKIENKELFVQEDNYQLVFSVGSDEEISFRYEDGSPAYADFYVCVEDDFGTEELPVYFSQTGDSWNFLQDASLVEFLDKRFVNFEADHFTYFAVGASE